jgi:long-chain acyl-CoA synthetase
VYARVSTNETLQDFRSRMHAFCKCKLARFMIPQKVELVESTMHGDRFKKMRRS